MVTLIPVLLVRVYTDALIYSANAFEMGTVCHGLCWTLEGCQKQSLPSRSLLFLSDRYEKRQLQIIKGIEKLKLSKKCRMMLRFLVWATDLGY